MTSGTKVPPDTALVQWIYPIEPLPRVSAENLADQRPHATIGSDPPRIATLVTRPQRTDPQIHPKRTQLDNITEDDLADPRRSV